MLDQLKKCFSKTEKVKTKKTLRQTSVKRISMRLNFFSTNTPSCTTHSCNKEKSAFLFFLPLFSLTLFSPFPSSFFFLSVKYRSLRICYVSPIKKRENVMFSHFLWCLFFVALVKKVGLLCI